MQFTAQAIVRSLKEKLDMSVAGASSVSTLDSAGYPILVMTKGSEKHFLKVEVIESAGFVDGLGLPQRVYAPHKAKLVLEASATATELAARFALIAKVAKLGMKVEIFEGTGVESAVDFDAALALATKITELKSDEIHPSVLSV